MCSNVINDSVDSPREFRSSVHNSGLSGEINEDNENDFYKKAFHKGKDRISTSKLVLKSFEDLNGNTTLQEKLQNIPCYDDIDLTENSRLPVLANASLDEVNLNSCQQRLLDDRRWKKTDSKAIDSNQNSELAGDVLVTFDHLNTSTIQQRPFPANFCEKGNSNQKDELGKPKFINNPSYFKDQANAIISQQETCQENHEKVAILGEMDVEESAEFNYDAFPSLDQVNSNERNRMTPQSKIKEAQIKSKNMQDLLQEIQEMIDFIDSIDNRALNLISLFSSANEDVLHFTQAMECVLLALNPIRQLLTKPNPLDQSIVDFLFGINMHGVIILEKISLLSEETKKHFFEARRIGMKFLSSSQEYASLPIESVLCSVLKRKELRTKMNSILNIYTENWEKFVKLQLVQEVNDAFFNTLEDEIEVLENNCSMVKHYAGIYSADFPAFEIN